MNETLWQMAYESDFRKACEILGYDPENLTEEQGLEIAEYLMTAEELQEVCYETRYNIERNIREL